MKKILSVLFLILMSFVLSGPTKAEELESNGLNPYFKLNSISFAGNSVYSDNALEKLISDKIGTTVTDWDLIVLVSKINYLYASEGYKYSDAAIENIDYKNGTSTINIREVRYDDIVISYDRRDYDSYTQKERIEKILKKLNIKPGNLVNITQLQRFEAEANASKNWDVSTEYALVSMPDNPYSRILKIKVLKHQ